MADIYICKNQILIIEYYNKFTQTRGSTANGFLLDFKKMHFCLGPKNG